MRSKYLIRITLLIFGINKGKQKILSCEKLYVKSKKMKIISDLALYLLWFVNVKLMFSMHSLSNFYSCIII